MAQKQDACVQTCQANADDEKERLTAEELPALQSIPAIRHTPANTVMLGCISTGLQAGTPLSVLLFSVPAWGSLHLRQDVVQDVRVSFLSLACVVIPFSLSFPPHLLVVRNVQNSHNSSKMIGPISFWHCAR